MVINDKLRNMQNSQLVFLQVHPFECNLHVIQYDIHYTTTPCGTQSPTCYAIHNIHYAMYF